MVRIRYKKLLYPWSCWLIVALLYLFQYGLLVLPSVFSNNLELDFSIKSTGVGVLYSAFLYTYVFMQIPVGVIYDRYRCNRVLFLSAMSIVMGCLIFSIAHHVWMAVLGRMLMGFGGSFAFIGALYLGRSWFPVVMFPLIIGLTESMSGLSEIGLLPILAFLKNIQTWRTIQLELTLVITIFAVLIYFFVRERHPERKKIKKVGRSDFNLILKNPVMWLLSFYVGFMFSFEMVIANMWGIPLLRSHYHIPTWLAAVEAGLIMVGFTLGCYLIGWIAQFFSDRFLMLWFSVAQFVLILVFWYFQLDLVGVGILVFLIGFTSSVMILPFDLVKKLIPETSYGLASGFLNMFFGGTGILISPLVGYIYQTTNDINQPLIPLVVCSGLAVLLGFILYRKKLKYLPLKAQGGV